ncbi:hypothetical protein EI42_03555 [Thermosporothrix hazakensis]|jgi:SAM-dependent methyltransferase|uniref:Methyltransferase type 11 domain-containing protein n=1 Tax=Thermosporothrix hazakensis TaxID=644383 RepID=A0A326U672_THEHA|nr:methyltransferase domain-containing protein [Thermosporothrix hazakensis]PZW27468.1 hypothetical protein EI42_03555 [Thermosporothrix hazakensis]GCE45634.1 methyltransferase [Thermosporothrix hazakensis]
MTRSQKDEAFYRSLVNEYNYPFSGWDFSHLNGRMTDDEQPLPWEYREEVKALLPHVHSLLDMDTGGGELLASLQPFPPDTCATEGYPPNIEIARARLEPLNVRVYAVQDDENRALPVEDQRFELVINRHGAFDPRELWRVLKPGGLFVTQQVGGNDNIELNRMLGAPEPKYAGWNCETAVKELQEAGFEILTQQEAYPVTRFYDVGALVFYLKVIEWQIPDFSVERYFERLLEPHGRIQREGSIVSHSHRFFVKARKPTA